MAQFEKHFVQDLTQDIEIRHCGTIVFNADNLSNIITIDLYNGKEPYSGGGSVSCSVICPDGVTVPVTNGSISGNTVTVTLTGDCFILPGQIGVGVQVITGNIRTTVLKAIYNVELFETDTIADPRSRITMSVGQLVNDIENATAQIPASDMASLMDGITPTFSNTANYTAGAYVYYNGTLYRFTANHTAGSWTGTDATAAVLGNDISVLKSAFENMSVSQVSGYYNLIPKLANAQIYNNKRMGGFNTSGATPVPNLIDQSGYTAIVVPVASFEENVTFKWQPGSSILNNYGIISRYSTTGTGYNMVSNASIGSYSNWDFAYDAVSHAVTVKIDAIKNTSTDMLVFCWYDQYPYIFPTSLQALDSGTVQLKNIIGKDQLTTDVQSIINNSELVQSATVVLPRRTPIVSGVQLGIYYENILYGKYLRTTFLNKQQDGNGGTFRDDSWHFTPSVTSLTNSGSNFRFYPYSLDNYTQYSTTVVMVPKSHASGTYKGIVIGDSKVAQGTIMDTLSSLFSDDGTTTVQFLGTLQTTNGVKHEGRNGWGAKQYCENASYNGSTNPFLNNGAFDFNHYLSANSIATPDFVCINLGTNDVNNGLTYAATLNYYQTMINSIHAVSANIKVIIGLTENMCQLQFNYNTNKDRILGLVKAMIAKWDNDTAYNAKIYLCPIYLNMNLYKDYNFSNVAESNRNPELIPFPTDYVHQSAYGFYKNADMIYSSIKYYIGI